MCFRLPTSSTPGDLAHGAAVLASPVARSITGQSIMDGGRAPSILNYGPGVAVTPQGT